MPNRNRKPNAGTRRDTLKPAKRMRKELASGEGIEDRAIKNRTIDDGQVDNRTLATNAGNSRTQQDSSLTSNFNASDGSTVRSHFGGDTIGRRELLSHPTNDSLRAVRTNHIGDGQVTNEKIDSVGAGKLPGLNGLNGNLDGSRVTGVYGTSATDNRFLRSSDHPNQKKHGNEVHGGKGFSKVGHTHSIPAKNIPAPERQAYIDLRAWLRDSWAGATIEQKLEKVRQSVLALQHLQLDSPGMTFEEMHERLVVDPDYVFVEEDQQGVEQDPYAYFYTNPSPDFGGQAPTAVQHISYTTASENGSSFTLAKQGLPGDLMVVVVYSDAPSDFAFDGWLTAHLENVNVTSGNYRMDVFYRFATPGDPEYFTFTATGASRTMAVLGAYARVNTSPIQESVLYGKGGESKIFAYSVPSSPGDMHVACFAAIREDSPQGLPAEFKTPAGMTRRADFGLGNDHIMVCCEQIAGEGIETGERTSNTTNYIAEGRSVSFVIEAQ